MCYLYTRRFGKIKKCNDFGESQCVHNVYENSNKLVKNYTENYNKSDNFEDRVYVYNRDFFVTPEILVSDTGYYSRGDNFIIYGNEDMSLHFIGKNTNLFKCYSTRTFYN